MKKVFCLLCAIFLLFAVSACSKKEVNSEKGYTKKTVTLNVSTSFSPILQVIKLNDLLTPLLPDDVKVEYSSLATGDAIRDAMIAGRVDIGSMASTFAISAIENGLPIRIFSNSAVIPIRMYSTNDNINSIYDLTSRSKITLTTKGSTVHFAFALRCKDLFNNALLFDDQFTPVPNADVFGLMQTSRDYDAFLLPFPTFSKIPDGMNYHLVEDLVETCIKYGVGLYIVMAEDFARDNPVLVEAFNKASGQAVALLRDKPEEYAVLLSEFYDISPEAMIEILKQCPPELEISGYDETADLMFETGMLSKPAKKFSELPNFNEIPK